MHSFQFMDSKIGKETQREKITQKEMWEAKEENRRNIESEKEHKE